MPRPPTEGRSGAAYSAAQGQKPGLLTLLSGASLCEATSGLCMAWGWLVLVTEKAPSGSQCLLMSLKIRGE